jgi:hypothetical protein
MYEETVYEKKKDPPGLWKFILIFVAFDVSLNIFLLVLLYLIKYLFKSDDSAFIIDNQLISSHIIDYLFALSATGIMAYLVGRVIVQKKYFKYKYEGMRAIRAFEKIVFYIAIVNILVPYFLIL